MSEPIRTVEQRREEIRQALKHIKRQLVTEGSRLLNNDALRRQILFANVSGALMDAGNIAVGDETTLADGVRQLTAERDRYLEALVRVARLWRAALPRPKGGQQVGVQHYVINSETSKELQRLLIAAGLDPDTLGVE